MNKLEMLKQFKEQITFSVRNIENYPKNEANVLISNHNCLMDIFYLPMALPEEIISLVSARLVYKNELDRKKMMERYLYAMPIEAHGGSQYANMCLGHALNETMSWYADLYAYIGSNNPWYLRGGGSSGTTNAGVFASDLTNGASTNYYSFRVVLR